LSSANTLAYHGEEEKRFAAFVRDCCDTLSSSFLYLIFICYFLFIYFYIFLRQIVIFSPYVG
jgi:hypothetical protein